MKKRNKLLLGVLPVMTLPMVAISCNWVKRNFPPIPEAKPLPKEPEHLKPNNSGSNNKKNEKENDRKYFYWGENKYKVAAEDVLDRKALDAVFGLDLFVKDEGKKFKEFIPVKENYYKDFNLNEKYFPTQGNMSYLIRKINLLELEKITNDREVLNSVVKNIKEWIADLSNFLNKDLNDTIESLYVLHRDDWMKVVGEGESWGIKRVDSYGKVAWDEVPFLSEKNINRGSSGKIIPSVLWRLNRDFDRKGENRFDSEMFLSKEFYEKTYDNTKYDLNIDMFDYTYANQVLGVKMQVKLINVLNAYLDFLEILTRKDLVKDANKMLSNILFKNDEFVDRFDKFSKALLEYIKLNKLLGFTVDNGVENTLQLFSGSSNYVTKLGIDFRDAYAWSLDAYHNLVGAFREVNGEYNYYLRDLNNNFDREYKEKYEFIWKYLKQFDGVDKPEPLSEVIIKDKMKELVKVLKAKFGWEYKE
ncbi:MAG3960 family lipoprotein [Mycoplasmopsis primatum]|uniref:MAG3960 family lipoprotein n=1 Tax=Mycoplasmopsis primatum TaxID=55604 RepID=UPI0004950583|nr:hypothetical protein [Mycoplasmopsis primatum]